MIGRGEGGGWRFDGEQSGYIMRPTLLPTLTPFVQTDTVPITDVQRTVELFLVLLHLVGLCWKGTFKMASRGFVRGKRFFICDNEARLLIMCFGGGRLKWPPLPPRQARPSNALSLPFMACLDKQRFCISESINKGDGCRGGGV